MFSLIISIISIALVAALAAATVYFGGAAFNKGSAGADASAFINAGQQIAGAFTLASADGYTATTVASLSNGSIGASTPTGTDGEVYLAQIPTYKGDELVLGTEYVTVDVSSQVCEEVNKRATGNVADVATANTGLFGCKTLTAFYKVK